MEDKGGGTSSLLARELWMGGTQQRRHHQERPPHSDCQRCWMRGGFDGAAESLEDDGFGYSGCVVGNPPTRRN
ncbi:unnamed protein product [Linum trigynum]|uniref:Uncharacterized protein n=1 Tax=Linum trigynum TaxID=586398 RepID=A0AAV2EPS7_9ROSI